MNTGREEDVAVHEAGHAVVAWFCNVVPAVAYASIIGKGNHAGETSTTMLQGDFEWCGIVIAMAGMAAEVFATGKTLAFGASSDMAMALKLVRRTRRTPPWPIPDGRTMAFSKMFHRKLTPDEETALAAGFKMASHILRHHQVRFFRLVSSLLATKRVGERELAAVLGDRRVVLSRDTTTAGFAVPAATTDARHGPADGEAA